MYKIRHPAKRKPPGHHNDAIVGKKATPPTITRHSLPTTPPPLHQRKLNNSLASKTIMSQPDIRACHPATITRSINYTTTTPTHNNSDNNNNNNNNNNSRFSKKRPVAIMCSPFSTLAPHQLKFGPVSSDGTLIINAIGRKKRFNMPILSPLSSLPSPTLAPTFTTLPLLSQSSMPFSILPLHSPRTQTLVGSYGVDDNATILPPTDNPTTAQSSTLKKMKRNKTNVFTRTRPKRHNMPVPIHGPGSPKIDSLRDATTIYRHRAAKGEAPIQELKFSTALRLNVKTVWGNTKNKAKILLAMGCLFIGKACTITLPLLFRDTIDHVAKTSPVTADLTQLSENSDHVAPLNQHLPTETLTATIQHIVNDVSFINENDWKSLPVALLVAYGGLRLSSVFFSEVRNILFASVVARAVEQVSTSLITRLLALDRAFHSARDTPALCKSVDRGIHALRICLGTLFSEYVPAFIELLLTLCLLALTFGPEHAGIVALTVFLYGWYTMRIVKWRGKFRRALNRADNTIASFKTDFLINWRTSQSLNNIFFLQHLYHNAVKRLTDAYILTVLSNTALRAGQVSIFSVGMVLGMVYALFRLESHDLTLGEFVGLHGFYINIIAQIRSLSNSYATLKASVLDLQPMMSLEQLHTEIYTPDNPVALLVRHPSQPSLPLTVQPSHGQSLFHIRRGTKDVIYDYTSVPAFHRPIPDSFDPITGYPVISGDLYHIEDLHIHDIEGVHGMAKTTTKPITHTTTTSTHNEMDPSQNKANMPLSQSSRSSSGAEVTSTTTTAATTAPTTATTATTTTAGSSSPLTNPKSSNMATSTPKKSNLKQQHKRHLVVYHDCHYESIPFYFTDPVTAEASNKKNHFSHKTPLKFSFTEFNDYLPSFLPFDWTSSNPHHKVSEFKAQFNPQSIIQNHPFAPKVIDYNAALGDGSSVNNIMQGSIPLPPYDDGGYGDEMIKSFHKNKSIFLVENLSSKVTTFQRRVDRSSHGHIDDYVPDELSDDRKSQFNPYTAVHDGNTTAATTIATTTTTLKDNNVPLDIKFIPTHRSTHYTTPNSNSQDDNHTNTPTPISQQIHTTPILPSKDARAINSKPSTANRIRDIAGDAKYILRDLIPGTKTKLYHHAPRTVPDDDEVVIDLPGLQLDQEIPLRAVLLNESPYKDLQSYNDTDDEVAVEQNYRKRGRKWARLKKSMDDQMNSHGMMIKEKIDGADQQQAMKTVDESISQDISPQMDQITTRLIINMTTNENCSADFAQNNSTSSPNKTIKSLPQTLRNPSSLMVVDHDTSSSSLSLPQSTHSLGDSHGVATPINHSKDANEPKTTSLSSSNTPQNHHNDDQEGCAAANEHPEIIRRLVSDQSMSQLQPQLAPGTFLDVSDGVGYQFHNVTLHQSHTNLTLLDRVSLTIKPNSFTAIVGAHRSGKSQILNLLARELDPTDGYVYMNDINLKMIRLGDLHGITGKVESETLLFNISAFDNVLLANRFASNQEVIDAMSSVLLPIALIPTPESLSQHPRQPGELALLSTTVGEKGGIYLNQQAKQRLALARLLIKSPKTILCDDVDASLVFKALGGRYRETPSFNHDNGMKCSYKDANERHDNSWENKTDQDNNNNDDKIKKDNHLFVTGTNKTNRHPSHFLKNKTVIMVSHDLKNVQHADMIHVLDQGRLVDSGTHNDLLQKSKYYANLWGEQREGRGGLNEAVLDGDYGNVLH